MRGNIGDLGFPGVPGLGFDVTGPIGVAGLPGDNGEPGIPGEDGREGFPGEDGEWCMIKLDM